MRNVNVIWKVKVIQRSFGTVTGVNTCKKKLQFNNRTSRTRGFNTANTKVRHWTRPWASSIQLQLISFRSIFILSPHLLRGFPSDRFPRNFPTKILLTFIVPPIINTCRANSGFHFCFWLHNSCFTLKILSKYVDFLR
jgi:hypothetical protein